MADNERKSSEDLIREARSRLSEPAYESHVDAEPTEERPAMEQPSVESVEVAPESTQHVYRSQIEDTVTAEPAGVSPIGYAPPERRSRVRPRLIIWGVIVSVGLGWGFFTSLDDADRDGSGEIVAGGDLDVMTVQVGDCFNDPDEAGVVYNLDAIPCSEPHDNEVFASASVSAVWSDYPGQDAVDSYAYDQCSGSLFDDFVGTPYLDSALDVFTLTPTPQSWDQGDREIICALYRVDFAKLTGTARDSRL
jgi:hypothetical protein